MDKVIGYGRQSIGLDDIEAAVAALEGELLTGGANVGAFERAVADYCGARYGVAVSSGTAALHCALLAAGVGPGDEVIVPALTFVATANAVVYCGATPVVCDVEPGTLTIDFAQAARLVTPRTKAIIPVDYAGQTCDYEAMMWRFATAYPQVIPIVDGCHALGAVHWLGKVGTLGDLTCFSFHPVKAITSVTPDTPVFVRIRGVPALREIGTLDESVIGQQCMAFSPDGGTKWATITDFIRHPIKDVILHIRLEKGKRVSITREHSLFTYENGVGFKPVRGDQLKVGDYVAVPRQLRTEGQYPTRIDLLEHLKHERLLVQDDKIRCINVKKGGNAAKWIDRYLPVNEDLCRWLGYFVAEGSIGQHLTGRNMAVTFTFGATEEKTYVEDVLQLTKRLFPYQAQTHRRNFKGNPSSIQIVVGTTMLAKIIMAFNCGIGAHHKRIPDLIWNVSDECKWAFIEGLMNGDGSKRNRVAGTIEEFLGVASKELANGLHYLLLTLGIQSGVRHAAHANGQHTYWCVILDRGNQKTCKENTVPKQFVAAYTNHQAFSIARIMQNKFKCDERLLADIALLRVTDIKTEPYEGDVYDFSVEGLENFVGGYGAVCLHNTGGEGGMVVTNDQGYAEAMQELRNHGGAGSGNAPRVGYNYRLAEVASAVGLSQLAKLEGFLARRREIAWRYREAFAGLGGIKMLEVRENCKHAWHIFVLRVVPELKKSRDQVREELRQRGIGTQIHYKVWHLFDSYRVCYGTGPGMAPVAEQASEEILTIPLYPGMSDQDVDHVIETLQQVCG